MDIADALRPLRNGHPDGRLLIEAAKDFAAKREVTAYNWIRLPFPRGNPTVPHRQAKSPEVLRQGIPMRP